MSVIDKDKIPEKEIDLLDFGKKLWSKKKFIGFIALLGLVVGVVIAFSIPKEYTATVVLTPESSSSNTSLSSMGALAAMAGINLPQGSQDALSPDLYPNIAQSTPFVMGLLNIEVNDEKENIHTNLYTYLKDEQKIPWWSSIFSLPSKLLGSSHKEDQVLEQNRDTVYTNVIDLSMGESSIIKALSGRMNVIADKKTGTITLSSTMQSPQIAAYIVDTLTSYLQTYIIDYRTHKARQDLLFTEKLYNESKNEYYKAQKNYATYSDENLDIISARYRTTKERLQNEMDLAYTVYNQMAQQLQVARVKVQDTTPVYTIIEPAVVPLFPNKPNKKLIVIGFFFAAVLVGCSWVILKEYLFINK